MNNVAYKDSNNPDDSHYDIEFEIIDLDPLHGGQTSKRWLHWLQSQHLSPKMRRSISLLTLLSIVLFGLLLAYPPHVPGQAAGRTRSSPDGQMVSVPLASFSSTAFNPSNVKQWIIVDRVTYLLTQDGIVKALWLRHGFYYQLWLHYVPPSSMLMRVVNHVLYFAAPDGTLIALRTSDGYVLWIRKRI